jgi:hypothetical protein
MLLTKMPAELFNHLDNIFPALSKTLKDPDDEVVRLDLEVNVQYIRPFLPHSHPLALPLFHTRDSQSFPLTHPPQLSPLALPPDRIPQPYEFAEKLALHNFALAHMTFDMK